MAVQSLHDAVVVLGRIRDELERVLDLTAPFEAEYVARWREATDPATGDRIGVAGDRFVIHSDEARPYFHVVDEIACMAGDVERRMAKAQGDHWRSAEAPIG
jgi:hypothetical protein